MKIDSFRLSLALVGAFVLAACSKGGSAKKEIWIYTSTYKEVLALYEVELKKAFPEVEIKWFQAGSEAVSSKVLAELQGGKTQADLMMTSDLFFYQEMKQQGQLVQLPAESVANFPKEFVDAERAFAVIRIPAMVLSCNDQLAEKDCPKSFKELTDARFKGKISMPSPLESGTALTAAIVLHKIYGDDYFKGLRTNDVLAAGGNSAVMARVQSGERPVGVILMENVLQALEKGQKGARFLIPEEGVIPVGSPLAIFKSSRDPALAQKIFDWFLSDTAQRLIVKGWIYSPVPTVPAPNGAPEWASLKKISLSLTELEELGKKRQPIKELFQRIVLN